MTTASSKKRKRSPSIITLPLIERQHPSCQPSENRPTYCRIDQFLTGSPAPAK